VKRTTCRNGHLLDEANTYVRPSRPTERRCRACERARQRLTNKNAPPAEACKRGHLFTPENTRYIPQGKYRASGQRQCRTCDTLNHRARRLRLVARKNAELVAALLTGLQVKAPAEGAPATRNYGPGPSVREARS
jgi:hypothetical protein